MKRTVKVSTHGNPMPEQHGEWIDLHTAEDADMKQGEIRMISLGTAMELPPGCCAYMLPRSSTAERWGVLMANSMGVIENSFCGDSDIWHFPAYAVRDTFIPKGTRICQFQLAEQAEPPRLVKTVRLKNRPRGGLGSTGR